MIPTTLDFQVLNDEFQEIHERGCEMVLMHIRETFGDDLIQKFVAFVVRVLHQLDQAIPYDSAGCIRGTFSDETIPKNLEICVCDAVGLLFDQKEQKCDTSLEVFEQKRIVVVINLESVSHKPLHITNQYLCEIQFLNEHVQVLQGILPGEVSAGCRIEDGVHGVKHGVGIETPCSDYVKTATVKGLATNIGDDWSQV